MYLQVRRRNYVHCVGCQSQLPVAHCQIVDCQSDSQLRTADKVGLYQKALVA